MQIFVANATDAVTLDAVVALLARVSPEMPCELRTIDGLAAQLPESLVELMRDAAHSLASGHGVTLSVIPRWLRPHQAAVVLNVSTTFLATLLEQGELVLHDRGDRGWLALDDVLAYKRARDVEQLAALDELAALSQDATTEE